MKEQQTHLLLRALAFAAEKHRFQKRKDTAGTPYIYHPIQVALTLTDIGNEHDTDLLIAAILHDTIEDTETTADEIENAFGKAVRDIVLEVTDDKSLPKEERKNLQVAMASKKSAAAQKLKLADKICNVHDIILHPPGDWSDERKLNYLLWAEQVQSGLKGANAELENHLTSLIEKGRAIFRSQPAARFKK